MEALRSTGAGVCAGVNKPAFFKETDFHIRSKLLKAAAGKVVERADDNSVAESELVNERKHLSLNVLVLVNAGFELDIDYPYEIIRKDNLVTRPDHIPYNTTRMRYRHYGHTLEVLIKKAIEFPEGNEKRNLIALICNHMKKDYMAWNKDTVDDKKIAEDLYELSDGKLQMTDDIVRLMAERLNQNYRPKTNYTNNRQNNQRRNYRQNNQDR